MTEQISAGTYYALTYQGLYGFGNVTAGMTTDYQLILFMSNATINGFDFQGGDIAISYGRLSSVLDGAVTVGVAGSTSDFTGTTTVIDGQLLEVSSLPTGNQFLLYQPHQQPIFLP